jgi:hypothetical protein
MNLPKVLPDETLFSRYVRHMMILGVNEKEYLKLLFNNSRISIHPYLTVGISNVASTSEESVHDIFETQTLGPLFSYFLPSRAENIFNALCENDGSKAFRQTQLVCFKESQSLSIKFCPICVKDDLAIHGVSYWHRVHQVPGLEACPHHKTELVHHQIVARPHIKPGLLPIEDTQIVQCSNSSHKLAKYIEACLKKITSSQTSYSQQTVVQDLKDKGYMTESGRFRKKQLIEDFFLFTQKMKYPRKELLPISIDDNTYFRSLLYTVSPQHPFKYLLLNFWLNSVKKISISSNGDVIKSARGESNQKVKSRCIKLLKNNKSLTKIHRLTGKSYCYLKRLAALESISVSETPTLLTVFVRKTIIRMAYKGFHRGAIAKFFEVSIGSVEQVISSQAGLVKYRKKCKFHSMRRRYKAQMLRSLAANKGSNKEEIKKQNYAAFHWLYRHERAWLNSHLPEPQAPRRNPRVNWKVRDLEISVRIKEILVTHPEKLSRTALDELLGGHGWLTKYRAKLPKSLVVYNRYAKTVLV